MTRAHLQRPPVHSLFLTFERQKGLFTFKIKFRASSPPSHPWPMSWDSEVLGWRCHQGEPVALRKDSS